MRPARVAGLPAGVSLTAVSRTQAPGARLVTATNAYCAAQCLWARRQEWVGWGSWHGVSAELGGDMGPRAAAAGRPVGAEEPLPGAPPSRQLSPRRTRVRGGQRSEASGGGGRSPDRPNWAPKQQGLKSREGRRVCAAGEAEISRAKDAQPHSRLRRPRRRRKWSPVSKMAARRVRRRGQQRRRDEGTFVAAKTSVKAEQGLKSATDTPCDDTRETTRERMTEPSESRGHEEEQT